MSVTAGRIIVVEDELARAKAFEARRKALLQAGKTIPPLVTLTPSEALAHARAMADDGSAPWRSDDLLLVDCWDRDLPDDGTASFKTVLFALDILAELRAAQDAAARKRAKQRKQAAEDEDVEKGFPRVVAYSKAMPDPLVRAALAEFAYPVRRVREEGGDPVWRFRLDRSVPPHGDGVPLWAVYDTQTVFDELHSLAMGERRGALPLPDERDRVYADFLATSCFASFHAALREGHETVWRRNVVGGLQSFSLKKGEPKALLRLGRTYLEVNPKRGATYKGLVQLARRIAQPPAYAPAPSTR